jgi:hypothetical protein
VALASFPAAIVTIFPLLAILLDTTELVPSVQPSAPPNESVKISWSSLTPRRRASTRTGNSNYEVAHLEEHERRTIVCHRASAAEDSISGDRSVESDSADVEWITGVGTDDALEICCHEDMTVRKIQMVLTATCVPCPS